LVYDPFISIGTDYCIQETSSSQPGFSNQTGCVELVRAFIELITIIEVQEKVDQEMVYLAALSVLLTVDFKLSF
jgi:hypothetical protein